MSMKIPFDALPEKLRNAIVEAQRAKEEKWYSPSIAHEVVRDHWGIFRAHPDPTIRKAMDEVEAATTRLQRSINPKRESLQLAAAERTTERLALSEDELALLERDHIELLSDNQRNCIANGCRTPAGRGGYLCLAHTTKMVASCEDPRRLIMSSL